MSFSASMSAVTQHQQQRAALHRSGELPWADEYIDSGAVNRLTSPGPRGVGTGGKADAMPCLLPVLVRGGEGLEGSMLNG